MKKYNVVGVCGGNGVLLHPFIKKPYSLLANIEARGAFFTPSNIQWRVNFKDTPLLKKVEALDNPPKVHLLVGAPDCGHSSIMALTRVKKLGVAKDNVSLNQYLKAIATLRPTIFAMENLVALLDQYTELEFKETFPDYRFIFIRGSVGLFGNSQLTRKRLLIIGVRKKYFKLVKLCFKVEPINKAKLKKAGDLIGDLFPLYPSPSLCHVREPNNTIITMYSGKKLKVGLIKRRWIGPLAFKKRWPVEDRNFSNAPGVYRNLEDDYPATARKQNRQYNHAGEMMTPRELARIQGVPDSFKLVFSENNPNYWINKGRATVTKCPPYEMATWLHSQVLQALNLIYKSKN